MLTPVILSGGAGTRLWPLSRELYPKQLLPLLGKETLLQATVMRVSGLDVTAPIIVCNEAHRFLVAEQLRAINAPAQAIVLEPVGRNTAPAIALAALVAQQGGQSRSVAARAAGRSRGARCARIPGRGARRHCPPRREASW